MIICGHKAPFEFGGLPLFCDHDCHPEAEGDLYDRLLPMVSTCILL